MLQQQQIIGLIENTGLYFFDQELTETAPENRDGIKFLKFISDEESSVFEQLNNLLIPLSISIDDISKILRNTYRILYTNEGKNELRIELKQLLNVQDSLYE